MSTTVEQAEQTQTEVTGHVVGKLLPVLELTPEDLVFDDENPYDHDKRNLEVIGASLDEVGGGRSILIDENNKIIAGNGTMTEAKKRGMNVVVVEGDKNTIVAVRRSDWTEAEKVRAKLYDNRAGDLHKANKRMMTRLVEKHPEQRILDGIFTKPEQERLLRAQADAQPMAAGGIDDEQTEAQTGTTQPSAAASAGVRVVSIFMSLEQQPIYIRRMRDLAALLPALGYPIPNNNVTDAHWAIVAWAHDQLVASKQQPVVTEETVEVETSEDHTVNGQ